MKEVRMCEAHPELLKLVTEVNTGLTYIQLGQDEMKKTLNELKNTQQASLLNITNALSDAKDFTREEANKIWPNIKVLEDRMHGAIEERNLKLSEIKEKLDTKIDVVDEKIKRVSWVWAGVAGILVIIEALMKLGIIHLGAK